MSTLDVNHMSLLGHWYTHYTPEGQPAQINQRPLLHNSLVGCPDLSCKEPLSQVAVGRVETSGSLSGVFVSILAWNGVYSSSKHNIYQFHHPHDTGTMTGILSGLQVVDCMVVGPILCRCGCIVKVIM